MHSTFSLGENIRDAESDWQRAYFLTFQFYHLAALRSTIALPSIPKLGLRSKFTVIFCWMDWFKGKSTGNQRFSHSIWGFPVIFPLKQSIDLLDGFEQQESERTVISYNIAMKAFEKAAFFVERRIPQNDTNLWAISTSIKQYQPVSTSINHWQTVGLSWFIPH